MPSNTRNVKRIGHYGTGDFELTLQTIAEFEETKYLINES